MHLKILHFLTISQSVEGKEIIKLTKLDSQAKFNNNTTKSFMQQIFIYKGGGCFCIDLPHQVALHMLTGNTKE